MRAGGMYMLTKLQIETLKKNQYDPAAKCVIVTVHGIRKGDTMQQLRALMSEDELLKDCIIESLDYGYVRALVNYIPFVRRLTAKYVLSFLRRISYQYPYANITVIAHSNGTWGIGSALEKERRKVFFNIDKLILFGSVLKRKFEWDRFKNIKVYNFYSTNDNVVLLAKPFYGMGWSGRYGFKKDALNLVQQDIKAGHTGFLKEYKNLRIVLSDEWQRKN